VTFDLLRSEWTKLRSLRSTTWTLLASIVCGIAMAGLAASVFVDQYEQLDAVDRIQVAADPVGFVLRAAAGASGIAVCVLGIMMIAGEHATGMISATLLTVPRRTPVLAAKAAVFGVVAFLTGVLTAVVGAATGATILSHRLQMTLDGEGLIRSVLGFGLYLGLVGLAALAVGALIRHVAGAIAIVLASLLALPAIMTALPGSVAATITGYLPTEAGMRVFSGQGWIPSALSPWAGLAALCAETVALLLAAAVLLNHRDV